MLPAPTTIATSTPRRCTRATAPAIARIRSGSVPYSSWPISDSPDSLSSRRLKTAGPSGRGGAGAAAGGGLGASVIASWGRWSGFSDDEAREASDDHILAGERGQLRPQLLDGLALVLV